MTGILGYWEAGSKESRNGAGVLPNYCHFSPSRPCNFPLDIYVIVQSKERFFPWAWEHTERIEEAIYMYANGEMSSSRPSVRRFS